MPIPPRGLGSTPPVLPQEFIDLVRTKAVNDVKELLDEFAVACADATLAAAARAMHGGEAVLALPPSDAFDELDVSLLTEMVGALATARLSKFHVQRFGENYPELIRWLNAQEGEGDAE